MKITLDEENLHPEINVKRFYVPGCRFSMQCPNCKITIEKNYSDHYLSYPIMNGIMDQYMYCGECDGEFKYKVKLNVSLELVEENNETN